MYKDSVTSLGYVVKSVLADLNLPETTYYMTFLKWAVDGYKAMNVIGLMPTVKTVKIPINKETRSAKIPMDYVDFLRIGICCNGIFINFDYNDEICLDGINTELKCACDSEHIGRKINEYCQAASADCSDCNGGGLGLGTDTWYWGVYANGAFDYSTPNFGIGPGFYHGGYRINKELGIIQFDSCVHADHFVMEYKSTGFDNMGDALVPYDVSLALREYVHWQRCRFTRGESPYDTRLLRSEAKQFEVQFISLMDDYTHRQNAMDKYSYLDIWRRYTFAQVKV